MEFAPSTNRGEERTSTGNGRQDSMPPPAVHGRSMGLPTIGTSLVAPMNEIPRRWREPDGGSRWAAGLEAAGNDEALRTSLCVF